MGRPPIPEETRDLILSLVGTRTQSTIANIAQVSHSTVSRVLAEAEDAERRAVIQDRIDQALTLLDASRCCLRCRPVVHEARAALMEPPIGRKL